LITIKDRKFLVVGLGKSGMASALFLKERGGIVTVTDSKPIDAIGKAAKRLKALDVKIEAGGHSRETFLDSDIIILSPGVPMSIQPIQEAREQGIRVISEIELAYNFIHAPIIAITGTNGKTTTTTLIGDILKKCQKKVFVGGNIGNPLIEGITLEGETEFVVAEVSSFQLEAIEDFRPAIGILLNISPDHLDRYHSYRDYIEAKSRIFLNQKEGDFVVLNADDPLVSKLGGSSEGVKNIYFGKEETADKSVYPDGISIVSEISGQKNYYNTESFKIKGVHNIENIMAAIAATEICGCDYGEIQEAINGFHGLEHRMEFVEEVSGVTYYNDSKATNIGAVEKSLESFDQPIILIAGGKDKGTGYDSLKILVKDRVKKLILLGEAGDAIQESLGTLTGTIKVNTLKEAVETARSESSRGDVVLFSPACSSFDMFRNYEERGDLFKAVVRELVTVHS